MCVIHDLQGHGFVASCQVGCYFSYLICGIELKGRFSKALNKCAFLDHRCFLHMDHVYKEESMALDYKKEIRKPPIPLNKKE